MTTTPKKMVVTRTSVSFLLLAIGAIALMMWLNNINMHVRLNELRASLRDSNVEDNNIDHSSLVMEYRLHQRLYAGDIDDPELERQHAHINSLLVTSNIPQTEVQPPKQAFAAVPVTSVINGLRYVLGKPPIRTGFAEQVDQNLVVAYYYERNHDYKNALEHYRHALEDSRHGRRKTAGIMLHEGFCHAMLSAHGAARKRYRKVIKKYRDLPVAVTAATLLHFLDGFASETAALEKRAKGLNKVEKLVQLFAYAEAEAALKQIKKSNSARYMLLKARVIEGRGPMPAAIAMFQKIITRYPRSREARSANRRILIAGTAHYHNRVLVDIAKKNNRILKDRNFHITPMRPVKVESGGLPTAHLEKYRAILAWIERPTVGAAKVSMSKGQKYRIKTIDDNIFIGEVVSQSKNSVVVQTIVRKVKVDRRRIVEIVKQ